MQQRPPTISLQGNRIQNSFKAPIIRSKCRKDPSVNYYRRLDPGASFFSPHFFKQPNPLLFHRLELLDTVKPNNISYLLILMLDRNQTLRQELPSVVSVTRASHDLLMTVKNIWLRCHPSHSHTFQRHKCATEVRGLWFSRIQWNEL